MARREVAAQGAQDAAAFRGGEFFVRSIGIEAPLVAIGENAGEVGGLRDFGAEPAFDVGTGGPVE